MVEKAEKARTWATAERAKTPLLANDASIASDLLGVPAEASGKSSLLMVETTRVSLALDAQGKCRGVYIVGAAKGDRALHGATWTAERLLAQVVGHSVAIQKPATSTGSTARWFESPAPVVALYDSGQLSELRIGDAAP